MDISIFIRKTARKKLFKGRRVLLSGIIILANSGQVLSRSLFPENFRIALQPQGIEPDKTLGIVLPVNVIFFEGSHIFTI